MSNNYFANLATERLFLRELQPEDAEEIFQLRSDEQVNEFIDRQRAVTLADAAEFIRKILVMAANNEPVMWAITLIGEGKLIGTVLYWNIAWDNCEAELGYELLPEYQGKGIMTEALKAVINFGFEELKFKTIVADPKKGNTRSIRLLEKLGFKLTGETDGGYWTYSLLSS